MSTIFLAGDSTVQHYSKKDYPQCGWGQFLCEYIDSQKHFISNHAIAGRSSRSFIEEHRLDAIEKDIKAGDYLLVQFGHNDASTNRPERFVSVEDFPYFLAQYEKLCQNKGARLIFVTPIAQLIYDQFHQVRPSFNNYRQSMIKFAKDHNLDLIDLGLLSSNYLNSCTQDQANEMYMPDKTHITETGARVYARFIADSKQIN